MMQCTYRSACLIVLTLGLITILIQPVVATGSRSPEVNLTEAWIAKTFSVSRTSQLAIPEAPLNCLQVMHASNKVLKNQTTWHTPLTLGEKVYSHGLFMDAPATVRVRLDKPAKEFSATVGVDNISDTQKRPEVGSVRFQVNVAGKRMLRSSLRKLNDKPLSIKVPLNDETEFFIEVDDGGNGRAYDQAVLANAEVTFQDGQKIFLDSLPIIASKAKAQGNGCPFFFFYDGKPSTALLANWNRTEKTKVDEEKTITTIGYECLNTGLLVETVVTTYKKSQAIDWLCYLENRGKVDTPIISDLVPIDTILLETKPDMPVTLRWSNGDNHASTGFMPHDDPLSPGKSRHFGPLGGRSSNGGSGGMFPFFNILGPDGGWVVAIGWAGQWNADFTRDKNGRVLLHAGMEETHFRLRPGERIRTPRIVLLRYESKEMIDGHNQFRRFVLEHFFPKKDGQPYIPPICHNTAATVYRSKQPATESNQLAIIRKLEELGGEGYWMDAYWYPQPWSSNVGNWFPRPQDFPRGLKPLADAAHEHGMKFILWFEPERVFPDTKFDQEHGDFLIKLPNTKNRLFNLGDPKALAFLTDFLDNRIKEWGVDIYRTDFNINPLEYWQGNDNADRRGITESRYIEGLYKLWGDLIQRNPGLCVDNCASGGRRIDIEGSRYSWPLWRSDLNDVGHGLKGKKHWPRMASGDQVHIAGLSLYLPINAGPIWDMRPYSLRSSLSGTLVLYERILHEEFPDELAKQGIAEAKLVRRYYLGDYYPLLKLTDKQSDWWAYQLHGTDKAKDVDSGVTFAFRRPDSKQTSVVLKLQRIDPNALYEVSITGETYVLAPFTTMTGRELQKLEITIPEQPGSSLIRYRKK